MPNKRSHKKSYRQNNFIKYLKLLKNQNYKCIKCGIDIFMYAENNNNKAFVIHHIDKNHKDNKLSNLCLVCASCHGKIHYPDIKNAFNFKGCHHLPKTKEKISNSLKEGYKEGRLKPNYYWLNKKLSKSHRKKISKRMKVETKSRPRNKNTGKFIRCDKK